MVNTTDFGSVVMGSSPVGPTHLEDRENNEVQRI